MNTGKLSYIFFFRGRGCVDVVCHNHCHAGLKGLFGEVGAERSYFSGVRPTYHRTHTSRAIVISGAVFFSF